MHVRVRLAAGWIGQRLRLLAVVATTVFSIGVLAPPALADEFGNFNPPNGGGPLADNANHTYCGGPGFDDNLKDNAQAATAALDAQTDMIDTIEACGAATTDVWWFDANFLPA